MFDHFPGLAWPAPYGTMLVLAGIMSWRLARRRVAAMAIDASHVDLALPLSLALGAAAAWGLDAAIPQESQLAGEQLQLERRLRLPLLAMAALPVLLAYCRVVGVPFRRFVDGLAPGSLLSIAVLRIGCFLGGCCFGDVTGSTAVLDTLADARVHLQVQTLPALSPEGLPWAVQFPDHSLAHRQHVALGLIAPDATASLPVHAVQLYESAATLLLGLWLWRSAPGAGRPGMLALIAATAYAALGFALQFLRADGALLLGPLNAMQLIYLAWLAAGLAVAARAMSARH